MHKLALNKARIINQDVDSAVRTITCLLCYFPDGLAIRHIKLEGLHVVRASLGLDHALSLLDRLLIDVYEGQLGAQACHFDSHSST